jgi:hypothetical protein
MKKIILIILFTSSYGAGFAQTPPFRVRLYHETEPVYFTLEQTSADIEGYDGDEIIVEAVPSPPESIPAAAAGLKQIAVPGNTKEDLNIRPRMQDDNAAMRISIPPGNYRHLLIKVPRTALVFVHILNNYVDGNIKATNVNSIQIEGIVQFVDVSNVTNFVIEVGENWRGMRGNGKVTVSNIRWTDAPVIVNDASKHRTCIIQTNNSDVVLSVADDSKTNIVFSSMYSQTYTNLNTDAINSPESDVREFKRILGGTPLRLQTLKLGGGGVNTIIGSTYGNVFIKKQE